MKLNVHRRLAADILGVGVNRIWIDPTKLADVSTAITREDIKRLIGQGVIRAREETGASRGRIRARAVKRKRGLRRGPGSRRGTAGARHPEREQWIKVVRPLRQRLRELRGRGVIKSGEYRRLYRMVKGGSFRSKAHLETYLRERLGDRKW